MKYLLILTIYALAFFGLGYWLLRFFSQLAGVDMLAAFAWGFKAKRFELVLTAILFYLIAFAMAGSIILGFFTASTALVTQKNGLAGYPESAGQYQMFDPGLRRYVPLPHFSPPPAAKKFDETFTLVSFYKPLFSKAYHNLSDLSLVVSVIKIVLGLLGIIPLYFTLFALAQAFGRSQKLPGVLTHAQLGKQFQTITGTTFFAALSGVIIVVLAITLIEHFIERRVAQGQHDALGSLSDEYRRSVVRKTAPGEKLKGVILRRDEGFMQKAYIRRTQSGRDVNKKEWRTLPAVLFTLRFSELIPVPVYLSLQLAGDEKSNPEIQRLDECMADPQQASHGVEFVVNRDYTVTLNPKSETEGAETPGE